MPTNHAEETGLPLAASTEQGPVNTDIRLLFYLRAYTGRLTALKSNTIFNKKQRFVSTLHKSYGWSLSFTVVMYICSFALWIVISSDFEVRLVHLQKKENNIKVNLESIITNPTDRCARQPIVQRITLNLRSRLFPDQMPIQISVSFEFITSAKKLLNIY